MGLGERTQLCLPRVDDSGMDFDHERLDVYQLSLDFLVTAERLVRAFPRGRAYFADQLGRTSPFD